MSALCGENHLWRERFSLSGVKPTAAGAPGADERPTPSPVTADSRAAEGIWPGGIRVRGGNAYATAGVSLNIAPPKLRLVSSESVLSALAFSAAALQLLPVTAD